MIQMSGSVDSGEIVHVGMVCGADQMEQAKKLAELQTQDLRDEEKRAISRRRAASADRRRTASVDAERQARASGELQAVLARRRAESREGAPVRSRGVPACTVASSTLASLGSTNWSPQKGHQARGPRIMSGAAVATTALKSGPVKATLRQPMRSPSAPAGSNESAARETRDAEVGPVGCELQAALDRRRFAIQTRDPSTRHKADFDGNPVAAVFSSVSRPSAATRTASRGASSELQAALAKRRAAADQGMGGDDDGSCETGDGHDKKNFDQRKEAGSESSGSTGQRASAAVADQKSAEIKVKADHAPRKESAARRLSALGSSCRSGNARPPSQPTAVPAADKQVRVPPMLASEDRKLAARIRRWSAGANRSCRPVQMAA